MNEPKNEPKAQPVAIYIGIAITLLFIALGIAVWVEGSGQGWSRSTRIIIELSLLSGLLLSLIFVKYFEAIGLWIASMRAARWLAQYDREKQAQSGGKQGAHSREEVLGRADDLRARLYERHGWCWRYRGRWVVIAGDESIVSRLAPTLVQDGYTISGDIILLYAEQTGGQPDTVWLDQIRRLRRRPVDAIVAVVRANTADNRTFDAEHTARRLVRHARALNWAAPAYVLNATEPGRNTRDVDAAIGCTWSNERTRPDQVNASLHALSNELADSGVVRLATDTTDCYPAELSQHIARHVSTLSDFVTEIGLSRIWRSAIHGVLFIPLFKEGMTTNSKGDRQDGDNTHVGQHAVWQTIANHSRHIHGRRVGLSLSTTAAWIATSLVGLWIIGTTLSGLTNRSTIAGATSTASKLSDPQDRTESALALDALQKQLDTLEIRQHDGARWYTHFGLNRDAALFTALWPIYESGATRIVVNPMRAKLEEHLRQLASLSDAEIASGGDTQIKSAYDTLKTYLMLAKPEHADAKYLTPQLFAIDAPARPFNSTLSEGAWQDLRQHLAAFYANHLAQRGSNIGTALAITPDASLVSATRQTVIGVRGIQNSTDAVYQQIIDDAQPKYPPASLSTLLGDTSSRGLFNTAATVPGVFTRAAWDERISKAIDEASEHGSVAGDWVLSDTRTDASPTASLKAELRQRYFDDYARAWQAFLNNIRWQPTPTVSGTVDQLTLLGDPQRSPLVALINVVVYQAGVGATTQSLSDSLLNKAQQLVGADEKNPSKMSQPQDAVPLASAFGPLLRLTGSDLATGSTGNGNGKASVQMAATGDLSLARYLERVTAMRLKLQQIMMGNDPDAMSRAAAQAVLQGKTSDIADSRDYASRVAASLGQQWAGLGDLFQQPLDQTWQVVLQPAASSLNDTWRTGILADWNRNFGGRYPFADSDNDASLPEMARFMRPDSGVISQFVTTQLAGVVERQGDRWVPALGSGHNSLTVDPSFLTALNTLMRVSTSVFPSGDARVRFELSAVSTPGVTDMKFVMSGRELHYFNQKQEWTPFVWPGETLENISRIEWQTQEGGLRSALDMQGRFGLIRLLERAKVTPQDNARYLLAWTPDQSQGIPLKVQLRSESGAGPLDMLALRHFSLPQRIFLTGASNASPKQALSGPPPLPAAMLESAKYADVPLPPGLPDMVTSGAFDRAPAGTAPQRAVVVSATKSSPMPLAMPKGASPVVANEVKNAAVSDRQSTVTWDEDGVPLSQARPADTPASRRKSALASRETDGSSHASGLSADALLY